MSENQLSENKETLQQLKSLLLSEDQERISILEEELQRLRLEFKDKETLINTLNPLVAELIQRQVLESPEEMAAALAPVMGTAIKHQITIAKDDLIDALYPVIGKTIRKSVTEAMKNLALSVNEKIEKTLSFQLIINRIKSRMSGIPVEQLVLSNALPFTVHEIFYIHRRTGILLTHYSITNKSSGAKEDVVSGMLTAIQDFAKTTFDEHADMDLKEIEYDDRVILLENGRHAYLALVVSGIYPEEFKENVHDLEANLHQQYAALLRDFDGDIGTISRAKVRLEEFIKKHIPHMVPDETLDKKTKFPFSLAFLLIFIVCLICAYFYFFPGEPEYKILPASAEKTGMLHPDGYKLLREELKQYLDNKISSDLSKIKFVIDANTLILEGMVSSEADRLLIGSAVAGLRASSFSVVLNNLRIDSLASSDNSEAINTIEDFKIYFSSGNFEIDTANQTRLKDMSRVLKQIHYKKLYITGHSDNAGSTSAKQKISLLRAEMVRDYLIKNEIARETLMIAVKADSVPEASNDSEDRRKFNRRVTFKIIK